MQSGLFDLEFRLDKIDSNGDPLKKLNNLIDWELFRADLEAARDKDKERKSTAGRKPCDAVLMFKILILQALYGLSDDAAEYQILDRLSFMRFLGLRQGDTVPDAKTIWLFRDQLTRVEAADTLFDRFDGFLKDNGYAAKRGQIVDASIVPAPVQRNTPEENEAIKRGETPEGWEDNPAKESQKDTDARWTKKNGKSHYGYRSRIHRKAARGRPLSQREKQGNKTKSRIRARVEHVFGVMSRRAGGKLVRAVGWARARMKIGLRNLAYNLDRYAMLVQKAG